MLGVRRWKFEFVENKNLYFEIKSKRKDLKMV